MASLDVAHPQALTSHLAGRTLAMGLTIPSALLFQTTEVIR